MTNTKTSEESQMPEERFNSLSLGICVILCLAMYIMKSLIFEPVSIWPLSFFCLSPWLIAVVCAKGKRKIYLISFIFGWAYFLLNMRWLFPATGLGYIALAFYLGFYFPLIASAVRHVTRNRHWKLSIVFPVVWVSTELLRAIIMTGFPWFFLSHSITDAIVFIQISDLVGAYGVSFLIASVNGGVADALLAKKYLNNKESNSKKSSKKILLATWATPICLLGFTLGYGIARLNSDTISDGPRVAVLQGDFVNFVNMEDAPPQDQFSEQQKRAIYLQMAADSLQDNPDLILLPESPWFMFLNEDALSLYDDFQLSYDSLQNFANNNNVMVVTGSASQDLTPDDPASLEKRYNSATIFYPNRKQTGRYDKVHVVPFGETVPFRHSSFHWLYLWLNKITPFSNNGEIEFSIYAGKSFHHFEMNMLNQNGAPLRFGIPICYEDVMPYVSRKFVAGKDKKEKQVDFLLNISNDGWFGRGIQQPQHLAICSYRSVENRVGIARAVNTGISGFIDPNGRKYNLVEKDDDNAWPGACNYKVAQIKTDSRFSFYSRNGDWFAWTCLIIHLAIIVDSIILKFRKKRIQTDN